MDVPSSTLDDLETIPEGKVAVWSRRSLLAGLTAILVAAAAKLLGGRTDRVGASGGGYVLGLTYASVSRAGLDVPWHVELRHAGGFPGDTVTLAITGTYFDIYETQGFHPTPSDETRDGDVLYLSFSKPPGDTLVVDYDAYIQPISQQGRSGRLSVVVDHRDVVSVDFTTRLMP